MAYTDVQLTDALYNFMVVEFSNPKPWDFKNRAAQAALNMCYQSFIQTHAGDVTAFSERMDRLVREVARRAGVTDGSEIARALGEIQQVVTLMQQVRLLVNDDNVVSFTDATGAAILRPRYRHW